MQVRGGKTLLHVCNTDRWSQPRLALDLRMCAHLNASHNPSAGMAYACGPPDQSSASNAVTAVSP
jgi:hypothetical protein